MTHTVEPRYLAGVQRAQGKINAGELDAAELITAELCAAFRELAGGFVLHARCAAARLDWPEALLRWDRCREQFPGQPGKWALGRANTLLRLGRHAEAEQGFADAVEAEPNDLAARVGLAKAVTARRDLLHAIPLWRIVTRRAPPDRRAQWGLALARAQFDAGRYDDAGETLRELLRDEPDNKQLTGRYAWQLIKLGRREEATEAVRRGALSAPRGDAAKLARLRVLRWLADRPAARTCLESLLTGTARVEMLTTLMAIIPDVCEAWDRTRLWLTMRGRLADASHLDAEPGDPASVSLRLRLSIALRDYDAFLADYATAPSMGAIWDARFSRLAAILNGPFPNLAAPKVFGIGLSRTATTTLASALEKLGYLTAHYTNPFSCDRLCEADFQLFDAAGDTPVSMRFESLFHMFPNARFILTMRDFEDWRASLEWLLSRQYEHVDFANIARTIGKRNDGPHGLESAIIHGALYVNHQDPRAAYAAYMERVDSFFAGPRRDRLLRFNVFAGDGWPELCGFLGRPIPDEAFPWENRSFIETTTVDDYTE